jgi:hypothetical protein
MNRTCPTCTWVSAPCWPLADSGTRSQLASWQPAWHHHWQRLLAVAGGGPRWARRSMGAVLAVHHKYVFSAFLCIPTLILCFQSAHRWEAAPRLAPEGSAWLVPVRSENGANIHVPHEYPAAEDRGRSWDPQWWAASAAGEDSGGFRMTPRQHFSAVLAARTAEGRTSADCDCETGPGSRHEAWEDRKVGCAGNPPELRADTALIESYAKGKTTVCRPAANRPEQSTVTCSFHHSTYTQKNKSASLCELRHVGVRMDLLEGQVMTDYSSPATPLLLAPGAVVARCDAAATAGGGGGGTDELTQKQQFIGPQRPWLSELLHGASATSESSAPPLQCDHTVNHTVLLMQRDNNLNTFHSAEDFLQTYIAYVALDLDPANVEVVIGDLVKHSPSMTYRRACASPSIFTRSHLSLSACIDAIQF